MIILTTLIGIIHRQFTSICIQACIFVVIIYICKSVPSNINARKYIYMVVLIGCILNIYISLFPSFSPQNSQTTNLNVVDISLCATIAIILIDNIQYSRCWIKYTNFVLISILISTLIYIGSRVGLISVVSYFFLKYITHKRSSFILFFSLMFIISCFFKSASTTGRAIIIKTAFTMLDSPAKLLFGLGPNGFENNYMIHQASISSSLSADKQLLLDNIIHPLNEFLLFCINYGCVTLCVLACILFLFAKHLSKSYLTLGIGWTMLLYSMLSHPTCYPIFIVLLMICYWESISTPLPQHRLVAPLKRIKLRPFMTLLYLVPCIVICTMLYTKISGMHKWELAKNNALLGRHEKAITEYESALSYYNDESIIFNYASFLLSIGKATKARSLMEGLTICNYETTILQGNIFFALSDYESAEQAYLLAEKMCPNRFLPLYQRFLIAQTQNNEDKMANIKKQLLKKPIKINSPEIKYMLHNINNL